jgi:hypothetical protein
MCDSSISCRNKSGIDLISYTGALFKVSLANTLVKAVPPVNPFIGSGISHSINSSSSNSHTNEVVSQLVGFSISQIWYTKE